jgi:hypothetical protein
LRALDSREDFGRIFISHEMREILKCFFTQNGPVSDDGWVGRVDEGPLGGRGV